MRGREEHAGSVEASAGPSGEEHDPRLRMAQMKRAQQRRKSNKPEGEERNVGDDKDLLPVSFDSGDKAKDGAGEADDQTPLPRDTGILTADVETKVGGKEVKLKAGTVVEVIGGAAKLRVKVFSGHEGAEAEIPGDTFKKEPGVATKDEKPRDDVYQEYGGGESQLWTEGGPKVDDVAQGFIGDCYLMAALGAVVAQNPGAIKKLFNPQTPGAKNYQITLYTQKDKSGVLQPETISVDTQLPSLKGEDHKPAYANEGRGSKAPLWPALLEKAYAQSKLGGYAEAGAGGSPGRAMEVLTGESSNSEGIPEKDEVLERFRGYKKEGRPTICATRGSMQESKLTPFEENHGAYHGVLRPPGLEAKVVPGTVGIADNTSKKPSYSFDDEKGKIEGAGKGKIDYETGKTEITFDKASKPDKAKHLEASFRYKGQVSDSPKIWANHAYIFEDVQGDKLKFRNPWGLGGEYDPLVSVDQFQRFFDDVATNDLPKESEVPEKSN